MSNKTYSKETVQTKAGYHRLKTVPKEDELRKYYAEYYYQEGRGSYDLKYTTAELQYTRFRQQAIEIVLQMEGVELSPDITMLDVGCGEGWTVAYFTDKGCKITGVDYSAFGFRKFHPELLDRFVEADVDEYVRSQAQSASQSIDVIFLNNVIEHVRQPKQLMLDLKAIVRLNGKVVVTYPNDFSPFQRFLTREGHITEPVWVAPPDHISYFNAESFQDMSQALGYDTLLTLGDFPIELYLANPHSNYVTDRARGKAAHRARVGIMNHLCSLDSKKAVNLMRAMGDIGFGRNLTTVLRASR